MRFVFEVFDLGVAAEFFQLGVEQADGFVKVKRVCRANDDVQLAFQSWPNRLPIVIPCHRVITKSGGLGGFMNSSGGLPLDIKRWLLHHERG